MKEKEKKKKRKKKERDKDSPQIAFSRNDGKPMNGMRMGRKEADYGVSGLVPCRHFVGKRIRKPFLDKMKPNHTSMEDLE